MADQQTVAAIVFFLGMLVAWFITMFDPWVGIAIGVLIAVAAVTVLLVARTQPSSDQHDSSVSDFDEEER
jgi:Co/Zn/Cd efflux system component